MYSCWPMLVLCSAPYEIFVYQWASTGIVVKHLFLFMATIHTWVQHNVESRHHFSTLPWLAETELTSLTMLHRVTWWFGKTGYTHAAFVSDHSMMRRHDLFTVDDSWSFWFCPRIKRAMSKLQVQNVLDFDQDIPCLPEASVMLHPIHHKF